MDDWTMVARLYSLEYSLNDINNFLDAQIFLLDYLHKIFPFNEFQDKDKYLILFKKLN